MEFEEKTVEKNYLFKGKILSLRKDKVLLPNGKTAEREVIEHCGGSAVLCEINGKILMVKQFRYPYKEVIWEIPAGKVNDGETPEQTAFRELKEEGGVTAGRIVKICDVYPSPGFSDEIVGVFKAEDVTVGAMQPDEDEFLSSEWIDVKTVKDMVKNGTIKDAKTLIALYWMFFNEK